MSRLFGQLLPLRSPRTELAELGDDALAAACATGDPVARAALFEQHVDAIHRFASRMCPRDPHVVDDLVQSTFLAAYRSILRFRRGGQLRSWLYGIAANHVRDHARREGRRLRALATVEELRRDPPAAAFDPVDRVRLARLPAAIDALPHDLRAVLILVDLEGQSGLEAAAALDAPEGTIWRRLYDARRRVRASLDGGAR